MQLSHLFARLAAATLLLAGNLALAADASAVGRIVVFGDSYSSAGNFNIATGGVVAGPPYHDGRFTNGDTWVDVLAGHLGVAIPGPSLAGGTNYAWGSSESGSGVSVFGRPNVTLQIEAFIVDHGGPLADDLIVVASGSGDLFWRTPTSPGTVVDNIEAHIRTLAGVGGQRFLVANLAPIGRSPALLGSPGEVKSDSLADATNRQLPRRMAMLADELGVHIQLLDMGGLLHAMLAAPTAFGFTDTTTPACPACGQGAPAPGAGDSVVGDPDRHLWWDAVHATRVFHAVLGDIAALVVLEAE